MTTLITIAFARNDFIASCLAAIPEAMGEIFLVQTSGAYYDCRRENSRLEACPRATTPEAWNEALKFAIKRPDIDFILFLHDDTRIPTNGIPQMRLAFDVFPKTGAVITDSFTGGVTECRPRHTSALMVSRQAFEETGFFDVRFLLRCDTHYMRRMEKLGYVIAATDVRTSHVGGGTTGKIFTPGQYAKQLDEERKLLNSK